MNSYLFPGASLERLATIGKMSQPVFFISTICFDPSLDKANEVPTVSMIVTSKQEELASLGSIFSMATTLAPTNLQQALYEVRQEFLVLSGENTGIFLAVLIQQNSI